MGWKHIDMEAIMRRVADRRIEEAMREGKFDNLPGAGKPIELDDMPANEDARLLWSALRLLRQNDVIPNEVRWRKQLDHIVEQVAAAESEAEIKTLVAAHGQLVREITSQPVGPLNAAIAPLSLEAELRKFRDRHPAA